MAAPQSSTLSEPYKQDRFRVLRITLCQLTGQKTCLEAAVRDCPEFTAFYYSLCDLTFSKLSLEVPAYRQVLCSPESSAALQPGLDRFCGREPGVLWVAVPGEDKALESAACAGCPVTGIVTRTQSQGDSWRVRSPLKSDLCKAVQESQHRWGNCRPA